MKQLQNLTAAELGLSPSAASPTDLAAALDRSAAKLAPLWTLARFVAVNPFLGASELRFEQAAIALARAAGARLTMPLSFYARAWTDGEIDAGELTDILGLESREAITTVLESSPPWAPELELVPTVADLAASVTGEPWPQRVTEAISSWAAGYFDEGLAAWPSPWRELSPYAAWRAEASRDRAPELLGLAEFRERVAALPDDPIAAAAWAIATLGLSNIELELQLHRLLMSVAGWAGFARYQGWSASLRGEPDPRARELLCVRLVWDALLLTSLGERGVAQAWQERRRIASGSAPLDTRALELELAVHEAYERSEQRRLLARLAGPAPAHERPINRFAQAVFCIDVRSEPLRRTLERLDVGIETRGFAGFFGVAAELVELGHDHGAARCPVLIEPSVAIAETVAGADEPALARAKATVRLREAGLRVWSSFKRTAVASFAFVEAVGLGYAVALVGDALGLPRPSSKSFGLDADTRRRVRPSLAPTLRDGRRLGMSVAERLDAAEDMLRTMGLTRDFASLVALFGHASTTVNNPHASALDCGACAGHSGAANARIAAALLNDPEVREGLRPRGITIPDETWFIAGLHDTTTDECELFDADEAPASHKWELERLRERLRQAGRRVRVERAKQLGVELSPDVDVDAEIIARSRDWAQVRPEWGLAGCAAFIIAPRRRTRGRDLAGRVFLHDYEHARDRDYATLATLMTAPMIVASWISLQYYGSTVDNQVFGCGTKLLHNVVGSVGVLEGRGGDLRSGLALESVHDGREYVHRPVRLTVIIEAPTEAINGVIAQHEQVRQLLDNGWVHLLAMDDAGAVTRRYVGALAWEPV